MTNLRMILCLEGELEDESLDLDEGHKEAVLDAPLQPVDVHDLGEVPALVSLQMTNQ